jgi:glutamine synthetase
MNIVEYIWLDSENNFRSKVRVLSSLSDINSEWNYDGSSTNQATTESSEIILKVVETFNHPFMNGKLNVCATYDINDNPLKNNYYHKANEIFNKKLDENPWFGLEQEYFLYKDNKPLGITLPESNKFYCSHINQDQLGVKIAHNHLMACLKAGIKISGLNAEVVPGQWEFQIGPVEGIDAGNHMMAARYLLERISINEGIYINYHPKPLMNYNGSGCHINFSTISMREENGLNIIMNAIEKLKDNHDYHMENYGTENDKRMTGHHETASFDKFTWGVGSRNTSVRIGYDTFKNKKGYFEDRRPASNIDPYLTTSILFETCCF